MGASESVVALTLRSRQLLVVVFRGLRTRPIRQLIFSEGFEHEPGGVRNSSAVPRPLGFASEALLSESLGFLVHWTSWQAATRTSVCKLLIVSSLH